METIIEIKFSHNENEIKKAISCYLLRVCELRKYAFIVYPILLAATAFCFVYESYAPLSFVFALFGYILYYLYFHRPIHAYMTFYKKRNTRIYCFSNENIISDGEDVQSQCKWTIFKKAYEIPTAFLLLDDNRFVYIFPKCFMHNEIDIDRLRCMLSDKFPKFKVYT